jgi:hypothetical protein
MLVAATCLVVIVLTVWIRSAGHEQPLDRNEVHRLRRFSEKLQREASLPFE